MISLGGVCGPMSREPGRLYEGGRQFKKHHFGPNPGELGETTPNGHLTEEFKCAQFLDELTEVEFWVRKPPHPKATSRPR